MSGETVHRDERTESVENASYRLAYLTVSFGLLAVVFVRALVTKESSWDLLAVVVAGGLVASVYQGMRGVITSRWVLIAVGAAVASAAIATVLALSLA